MNICEFLAPTEVQNIIFGFLKRTTTLLLGKKTFGFMECTLIVK
jgi:hypothetical protein